MDAIKFCEDIIGINLSPYQKKVLTKEDHEKIFLCAGRRSGGRFLRNIWLEYMRYIKEGGD